jgi:hypothetical protein
MPGMDVRHVVIHGCPLPAPLCLKFAAQLYHSDAASHAGGVNRRCGDKIVTRWVARVSATYQSLRLMPGEWMMTTLQNSWPFTSRVLPTALVQISNLAEAGLCFGFFSCSEDGVSHRGRGIGLNL